MKPSSAASETYNINMNTFDYGKPEEFLAFLKSFNIASDGTGTTSPRIRIDYLHTMLRGQALRELNEVQIQYGGLTNNNIQIIHEGLLEYFFPINSLSKKKCARRRAMHTPQSMTFKSFVTMLTEMKNYLLLFPGLDVSKNLHLKSSIRFSYMQFRMHGRSNPTFKGGILR